MNCLMKKNWGRIIEMHPSDFALSKRSGFTALICKCGEMHKNEYVRSNMG